MIEKNKEEKIMKLKGLIMFLKSDYGSIIKELLLDNREFRINDMVNSRSEVEIFENKGQILAYTDLITLFDPEILQKQIEEIQDSE